MTHHNGRRHDYHARFGNDDHDELASLFPHIMELAQREGNRAVFVIERPDEDTDDTMSFSAEALYEMTQEIMVFIVSRIMRSWDATTHAPKRVAIDCRVKVGGSVADT